MSHARVRRRCPECGTIAEGMAFAYADDSGSWGDDVLRQCPECHYIATTGVFVAMAYWKADPKPPRKGKQLCPSCKSEHPALETCTGYVYDFTEWQWIKTRAWIALVRAGEIDDEG